MMNFYTTSMWLTHTWTPLQLGTEMQLDPRCTWTRDALGPQTHLDPRHTWTRDTLGPEMYLDQNYNSALSMMKTNFRTLQMLQIYCKFENALSLTLSSRS